MGTEWRYEDAGERAAARLSECVRVAPRKRVRPGNKSAFQTAVKRVAAYERHVNQRSASTRVRVRPAPLRQSSNSVRCYATTQNVGQDRQVENANARDVRYVYPRRHHSVRSGNRRR